MTTTIQPTTEKKVYVTKIHKGVNFIGFSEEDVDKRISNFEYDRSVFYKSSVYTFSCRARLLDDKTVEYTKFYNNGESSEVTVFKSVDEFWKNM
jgi:hypothetical protein